MEFQYNKDFRSCCILVFNYVSMYSCFRITSKCHNIGFTYLFVDIILHKIIIDLTIFLYFFMISVQKEDNLNGSLAC